MTFADGNRQKGTDVYIYNNMKKFFVVLAVVFAVAFLGQQKAEAGGFFFPVPVPFPVFYGPGYYAPGYYWGPGGYGYYRRPYWRNRYWYHRRWYYR